MSSKLRQDNPQGCICIALCFEVLVLKTEAAVLILVGPCATPSEHRLTCRQLKAEHFKRKGDEALKHEGYKLAIDE